MNNLRTEALICLKLDVFAKIRSKQYFSLMMLCSHNIRYFQKISVAVYTISLNDMCLSFKMTFKLLRTRTIFLSNSLLTYRSVQNGLFSEVNRKFFPIQYSISISMSVLQHLSVNVSEYVITRIRIFVHMIFVFVCVFFFYWN